jgi:ATP-dependent RNA helicase DDX18/HAS1
MYVQGKKAQAERSRVFRQFCGAAAAALLCTDIAARGWDVPAVDWILQFDPPDDPG